MPRRPTIHYLCGAFLHEGRLCATDGNRLALRTVAIDAPAAPEIIVPSATVERIAALLRGVTGMVSAVVGQVQIVVSSADWTLTSKLIDGEFPDYHRLLPERSVRPLLVQRKALHDAAALVVKLQTDDRARGLRLTVRGGELLVESSGYDALGDCEITVPIEGEVLDLPRPVGLNSRFLLSALDAIATELVELHVADPSHPVWLCAAGEAHDGTVIMPMRV
jgi:DNA polymerase III subunit beta